MLLGAMSLLSNKFYYNTQEIGTQWEREREKNTKVANCSDEVLATAQSRDLAANALHFLGLCVLLERECERKKEIGEKGIVFRGLFAQLPALEWDDNHQKRRMLRLRGA